MSFTNTLEALFLHALAAGIDPFIKTLYVGLWDGSPGEDGTGGTEVSGAGYVRVDTFGLWTIPLGDPLTISNDTELVFAEATANWGTVTHFGLHEYVSGVSGLLAYGLLWSSKDIVKGSIPRFPIGSLEVALD